MMSMKQLAGKIGRSPRRRGIPAGRGRAGGMVTVWVALIMTVLCALAAMAVDAGQVAVAKARLQAATDAAALAAALDGSDMYAVAAEYCRDNLLADSQEQIQLQAVDGNTYTYTFGRYSVSVTAPYSDAFTDSLGYDASDLVRVDATCQVQPFFGTLGGRGPVTVSAYSIALRYSSSQGMPAIFTHETDPGTFGFWWTGSGGVIQGDVISNSRVKLSGSNHVAHGTIYYGSYTTVVGSGHQIDGGFVKLDAPEDWPIQLTASDLAPYDYYIAGNYYFSGSGGTIPPGVYYVTGDVRISGSGIIAEGVTFIAEGRIKVSGSGHSFSPARENVLFYSLDSNAPWTIDISGSGGAWSGICFAPNGSITFTGSGHFVHEGTLVANKVKIAGSDFEIRSTGGGGYSSVSAKLIR